jgi:hypothetical protein
MSRYISFTKLKHLIFQNEGSSIQAGKQLGIYTNILYLRTDGVHRIIIKAGGRYIISLLHGSHHDAPYNIRMLSSAARDHNLGSSAFLSS